MTSEQRKELRYQRRKAKREAKTRERNRKIGALEEVFTMQAASVHKASLIHFGQKPQKVFLLIKKVVMFSSKLTLFNL